mmetsp:Transcript_8073/g.11531  ORF Transcript_8073/g.11531 Transcript_8073/m.11531 type:complete len:516 (+) Transcript_8073:206-1753(+)|eukprot:CAMPEP_0184868678 /NCGR_PEP_ID=MMETSP0580-20130426/31364_1 /TAXON_ID=1118495 /ORGANISM="Dactyliosolen fragilissimus" /LENGTH=515 /DNA_ID=CAMNT_0027369725 /DNA_START=197 /DNA_END=1744 /DNA_ORIENTATION=-
MKKLFRKSKAVYKKHEHSDTAKNGLSSSDEMKSQDTEFNRVPSRTSSSSSTGFKYAMREYGRAINPGKWNDEGRRMNLNDNEEFSNARQRRVTSSDDSSYGSSAANAPSNFDGYLPPSFDNDENRQAAPSLISRAIANPIYFEHENEIITNSTNRPPRQQLSVDTNESSEQRGKNMGQNPPPISANDSLSTPSTNASSAVTHFHYAHKGPSMSMETQEVTAASSNNTTNPAPQIPPFRREYKQTTSYYIPSKPPPPTSTSATALKDANYSNIRHFTKHHHEPEMPDATYSEHYGDAYINAPIRYIYPSGYTSMRPRSGPWKISVLIFLSFTFLTVFIVEHCADRIDLQYYNLKDDEIDDDAILIETRWCGSRLLYFMWVLSALINFIATGYCGIIGYIKARDFAVANGRSQPPGMTGKSDYYVRIGDVMQMVDKERDCERGEGDGNCNGNEKDSGGSLRRNVNDDNYDNDDQRNLNTYQYGMVVKNGIYQSDGTPQFWGAHIYRPNQAAAAITSR